MSHLTRRAFVALIGVVAATVGIGQATAADEVTLHIADQVDFLNTTSRLTKFDQGNGYAVEYGSFNGTPLVLEALKTGKFDLAWASDVGPIFHTAAGVKLKIVAVSQKDRLGYRLFSAPGSNIKSVSELKGRKVAYLPGASYSLYIIRALAAGGLTLKDVELVRLDQPTIPEALRTSQVDAAALFEPNATNFLKEYGKDGLYLLPESVGQATGLDNLYATEEALADPARRAAIERYVEDIWIDGALWRNDNKGEWEQAYFVERAGVDPAVAKQIYDAVGDYTFPKIDGELIKTYQQLIDQLHGADELPSTFEAASIFDTSFDAVRERAVAGYSQRKTAGK